MIKKIASINYVNGFLLENKKLNKEIDNILKEYKGIKKTKVYLLDAFLNIVMILDENYELIYVIDGSFDKIERLLKSNLKPYNINLYMIIK